MKLRQFGYACVVFLASTWTLHTITNNFIVDPELAKFLVHKLLGADFNQSLWMILLRVHIVTACVVMITGLIGFSTRILQKHRKFHRLNGQLYMVSVLLSALSALYLVKDATGGRIVELSFVVLELLWIFTTVQAYRTIRRRDVKAHQNWMVRSYALSFSNTVIHLLTLVLNTCFHVEYTLSYTLSVWLSWMITLTIAEVWVRLQQSAGRRRMEAPSLRSS